MIDRLIAWIKKGVPARRVVTFEDKFLFMRYEFAWPDEFIAEDDKHYNRPPWYRPFNIMLHEWKPEPDTEEEFHDHPRWSISIVLKGRMIERTPWTEQELKPGSIVIRSRKYIHSFSVPEEGATTLFIVGRRNHRQNTYQITKH